MTTRQATWVVILAPALLRLAWAATLGPDTNEAYYYLYTRHPAWSYFDHPPMVAVVAELGLTLAGWISPLLGVRAGFIALFAASTWLLARLTARAFGARAGVLAALALNLSGYYGLLIGITANPDGPLLFFWLLTLDRLLAAFAAAGRPPAATRAWLGAGVGLGGALLSKYHAVLLPAGVLLYLVVRPAARRCLLTPGPYLATATAAALFTPVIWWNSRHQWASFLFQGHRAVGSPGIHPEWLAVVAGGSILFLFPWIGIALAATLVRLVRRGPRSWSDPEALLACQAVAVLGFFLGVTPFRRVMPHWPLMGFVALMPMLGRGWAAGLASRPGPYRRWLAVMAIVPVALAGLIAGQARLGILQDRGGKMLGLIPPEADPTVELIVWDQVARELRGRGLLDAGGPFLFTDSWRRSAQLAFAARGKVPVAAYDRDARSFAFWSRPEDWVGRDGILVGLDGDPPAGPAFAPWFDRIEPLGEFPILRSGVPVRTARLHRCVRQIRPYPFRYPALEPKHPAPGGPGGVGPS